MKTVFLLPLYKQFRTDASSLGTGRTRTIPCRVPDPFHQDLSQRIAVLDVKPSPFYLVLRVGGLLEFEDCGGSEISWDDWKSCVVIPVINLNQLMHSEVRVSGSRLFSIYQRDSGSHVERVYDFSVHGRAKYLSKGVGYSGICHQLGLKCESREVEICWKCTVVMTMFCSTL